jgi:hypothetical protein
LAETGLGSLIHVVGRQAEHDLKQFKEFIEHRGPAPMAAAEAAPTGTAPRPYNRFEHPFDQTNGLVDFEGESDETADGENYSSGERRRRRHDDGRVPPFGGALGQH